MNRKMAKGRRRFWLMHSNRGNTLIEVIVCVLIIGIAFVPLMVGLNASMKINKQNENKLYAENVASNIVEICKTYGQSGLEGLKALKGNSVKGIKAFLAGSDVELTQDGSTPERFYVSKISAGIEDKVYYADIEFDDTVYTDADGKPINQNDFSTYQSISGLSDAVIVALNQDSLESVVHNFFEQSAKNVSEDDMVTNATDWLKRQITITVKQVTIEEKTRYAVERKVEYIADVSKSIGGTRIFDAATTSVVYQSQPYEKLTVDGTPVGTPGTPPEDETYKAIPKSIILTYTQVKGNDGKYRNLGTPGTSMYDLIVNMDVSGGSVNVYALCTDVSKLENLSSVRFKVLGAGSYCGSNPDWAIKAYSNLNPYDPLNPDSTELNYTNCTMLTSFGDGSSGKQSKLKDVIIKVREGSATGDVVVEKKSTIIEIE